MGSRTKESTGPAPASDSGGHRSSHVPSEAERQAELYDWNAIAESAEFRALVSARRRFVGPWLVIWFVIFWVYTLLALYADNFMSASLYESIKVGYLVAVMVVLGALAMPWLFSRYSARVLDPLAERVRTQANQNVREGALVEEGPA